MGDSPHQKLNGKQKISGHIKYAVAMATLIFGLLTIINGPLSVFAQTATVGQSIDASAGALTLPCDLNEGLFEFQPVTINAPDPYFISKYTNPKTPYSDISLCDGSGLTLQDTRYEGGFVLQINATDYVSTDNPLDTIDITNLALVTEQSATSYSENASGTSAFTASGDSLLTGSQDDNAEIEYTLPFDFNYYGNTYTTVYLCDNGLINFADSDADSTYDTDSECSPPAESILEDAGPTPHIIPYYKDLNLNFGLDNSFGIYAAEPDANTVRFRWKGAPNANWAELVEFEVELKNNGDEDYITFNYADGVSGNITDAADDPSDIGPVVGITKGGTAAPPVSATYTESYLSNLAEGTDLLDKQAIFKSGFDFTEVKKPGTPAAVAQYNGDPADDIDFIDLTDTDDDGTSDALDIITGGVSITAGTCVGGANDGNSCTGDGECPDGYCTEFIPGRIGIYTIYPSFKLQIPNATPNGTYKNTITFTVSDSTEPI